MNRDGVPETVAFDLGGVLLTDGAKTAFRKLAAIYGGDRQRLTGLWHRQLRLPAELGHATAKQTMTLLADAVGGPVERVEELFLDECQPIPEGVDYLKQTHNAGSTVVSATNHVNERLGRRCRWTVCCTPNPGPRRRVL